MAWACFASGRFTFTDPGGLWAPRPTPPTSSLTHLAHPRGIHLQTFALSGARVWGTLPGLTPGRPLLLWSRSAPAPQAVLGQPVLPGSLYHSSRVYYVLFTK